jgi:hypothetical protein
MVGCKHQSKKERFKRKSGIGGSVAKVFSDLWKRQAELKGMSGKVATAAAAFWEGISGLCGVRGTRSDTS